MRKINNWWMIHCYVSLGVRKESPLGVGFGPQKLSFFRALVGRRRVQHIVDKQIDVEKYLYIYIYWYKWNCYERYVWLYSYIHILSMVVYSA